MKQPQLLNTRDEKRREIGGYKSLNCHDFTVTCNINDYR